MAGISITLAGNFAKLDELARQAADLTRQTNDLLLQILNQTRPEPSV